MSGHWRQAFWSVYLLANVGMFAGCATTAPPPPAIVQAPQVVTVERIVRVPCVNEADIPQIPSTAMRPDSDVKQLEAQVRVDVDALRQYALKADPLLRGCATKPK
jgi:hypothetical protein